jgi:FRG domain
MERQFDLDRWEDLEAMIREISAPVPEVAGEPVGIYSHLLFRGQGSYGWSLETTLDRARPGFTRLTDYYRIAALAKTQVETFTSRTWSPIDLPAVERCFREYEALRFNDLPNYDYLVYLRHHGFPSPLLDWSRSVYIAAFFACQRPIGDRVAIFAYQEYAGQGKLSSSDEPRLHALGPNVRSHPRHFLQQGEYTLCVRYVDEEWHLGSHAAVFELGHAGQDRLWKLTLPSSEAAKVMRRLEEYNVTAFSLFQSEEALLETLAKRFIRS